MRSTIELGRSDPPQPSDAPRLEHRSRVWPALWILAAIVAVNTLSLGVLAWRTAERRPATIELVEVSVPAEGSLKVLVHQLLELELLLQEVEEEVRALRRLPPESALIVLD